MINVFTFLGAITFIGILLIFVVLCVAGLIALRRRFKKKSKIVRLIEEEGKK